MNNKNFPVFWRCFITYIICTLLFILILIYSYNTVSKQWQDSYVEQVSDTFSHNSRILSDDLFSVIFFPQNIGGSDYYRFVVTSTDNSPKNDYYISRVMDNIGYQKNSFQLIEDVLIYMKRSGAVISSNRFYQSADECFSDYYVFDRLDIASIIADPKLSHTGLTPLICDNIRIKQASKKDYLTILLNESSDNCVYIFIIPKSVILNHFQLDTLPENSFFSILNAKGEELMSSGSKESEVSGYVNMECDITSISGKATLSIPEKYFETVTEKAEQKVKIISALAALIGLALCFLFSFISTQPFRDIIEKAEIPENRETRNELVTIYNYLSETKENQKIIQSRLLSNLLVRAFSGIPLSENDIHNSETFRLLLEGPIHVAIIRCISSADNSELQSHILCRLDKSANQNFIFEPLNKDEIGLIFKADGTFSELLKDCIYDINNSMADKSRIICGVSAPFTGVSNISDAVQQALFSMPDGNEFLMYFNDEASFNSKTDNNPDLKSFQNALFNWNMNEVNRLISIFTEAAGKATQSYAQQIFYTLLASIKDAADAIKVPTEIFDECTFAKSISSEANVRALQKLTDYLFEQKERIQSDNKAKNKHAIVEYINENLGNPGLSIGMLAEKYNKTERVLNTIIFNETGQSFSQYLITIRMQRAAVLLRDTDMDVVEVAEICGLALSTFYRNFKKVYGMTPADYKIHFTK